MPRAHAPAKVSSDPRDGARIGPPRGKACGSGATDRRRGKRRTAQARRKPPASRGETETLAPTLTPADATAYLKLIAAGYPIGDAIRQLRPSLPDVDAAMDLAAAWMRDPLMTDAIRLRHGKPWADLEPDVRLTVARDQHLAEAAYFLTVHPFEELGGLDLDKARGAVRLITDYLAGKAIATDDPFAKILKDLAKDHAEAAALAEMEALTADALAVGQSPHGES